MRNPYAECRHIVHNLLIQMGRDDGHIVHSRAIQKESWRSLLGLEEWQIHLIELVSLDSFLRSLALGRKLLHSFRLNYKCCGKHYPLGAKNYIIITICGTARLQYTS